MILGLMPATYTPYDFVMMRFHERLRKARKEAGFSSQEKFAAVLGMKRTQYLLYETGAVTPDPEETIPRIAEGLGLPPETLKAWKMVDEYGSDAVRAAILEMSVEDKKALLKELLPSEDLVELIEDELNRRRRDDYSCGAAFCRSGNGSAVGTRALPFERDLC
jgi:transcriptional regulator with XRE-family HTH domain